MTTGHYHERSLQGEPLSPETLMMCYGYSPSLSEGAIKPPVFLTSTFVFRSAQEGKDFFDYASGRRQPPRLRAGATSTLNVALQAAADLGTPTYQPSTWNTLAETGAIAVANLTANTVIARFPWLPPFPSNLRPRYLRLLFSIATANMTAGTIASAIVTLVRDDQFNKYAAKNYTVA